MRHIKRIVAVLAAVLITFCSISASAATSQYPPAGLGTLHTYTVWDGIRWGGDCRKLINFTKEHNALSDSYGIVTYGSYFAGAMTSTCGKVGDMMLVIEEGNIVYPVIMADTKNQNDRGCTAWGHQYGKCMVEFEILRSCRRSLYGTSGGYISDVLAKPITQVINLGSVYDSTYYFWNPMQACIDNGLIGYTLLTNPYGGVVVETPQPPAPQVLSVDDKEMCDNQEDRCIFKPLWLYSFKNENGVIVPPCKIGDTVYCIKRKNIVEYAVLDAGREGFNVNLGDVYLSYYEYSEIGKSVFTTREEAEKYLLLEKI